MKKIVCISDTHGLHEHLHIPECDLLIHAGDATNLGKENEMRSFAQWLTRQKQAKEIVYVPGNHDIIAETDFAMVRDMFGDKVKVLTCGLTEVAGFSLLGYSYTPEFCGWGFQGDDTGGQKPAFRNMQRDLAMVDEADIMVCHGPLRGILSTNAWEEECGSETLRDAWEEIEPRLFVCGHIHESYGRVRWPGSKVVVNAALPVHCSDESYVLNEPQVVYLED
ncbi:MAG: hypothetical protein E6R03_08985 [Hyphomicrobiaceae bacterium]|nr:MAG: hypothetical protein E6R03_08985 [Hyphomicrobiaceae bacterium]